MVTCSTVLDRTPNKCSILQVVVLTDVDAPVCTNLQAALQSSLFGSAELRCGPIGPPTDRLDSSSSITFAPGWLDGSDVVFDRLRDDLPWRAMERPMYDRIMPVPRLICTVDIGSLGGTHPLRTITHALEKGLHARFSSVGVNYYRTGQDSVAWHRDSIYKTQRPSTVALVSLGSPRTLAVRAHAQYCSKTAETTGITPVTRRRWRLGHGDLLVMQGRCQRDWEHCVPKERAVGPRISLAFRS